MDLQEHCMSEDIPVSGHCLCGAGTFTAAARSSDVTACHCTMCSRWGGGVALSIDIETAPVFTGEDNIAVYKSSEWGERGFCKVCGSSLYWRLSGADRYTFSAGALDDTSHLRLAKEIFIDEKPGYYTFANDTVKQTGDEATEEFLAEAEHRT
jgi:hypothetical protein